MTQRDIAPHIVIIPNPSPERAHDRVNASPDVLRCARERAGVDASVLAARFPKLPAWERGELQPTLKQLDGFARNIHGDRIFVPRSAAS